MIRSIDTATICANTQTIVVPRSIDDRQCARALAIFISSAMSGSHCGSVIAPSYQWSLLSVIFCNYMNNVNEITLTKESLIDSFSSNQWMSIKRNMAAVWFSHKNNKNGDVKILNNIGRVRIVLYGISSDSEAALSVNNEEKRHVFCTSLLSWGCGAPI